MHSDRLEVLSGPTGRRRWTDEFKARVVAESLRPGIRSSDVARRYDLRPQHLSQWRRLAREGRLVLPDDELGFAPIMLSDAMANDELVPRHDSIEIAVSGVTIRLPLDCASHRVGKIAAALVHELGLGAQPTRL